MKRIPQILLILAMLIPMIGFAPGAASAWQNFDLQAGRALQAPENPAQVEAAPTATPGGFLRGIFMPFVSRPTFLDPRRVTDSQATAPRYPGRPPAHDYDRPGWRVPSAI
jgi:hypothetical protein